MIEFPELRQIYCYDCGACALACVLAYYGIDVREDEIMAIAGTTTDGTNTKGILKVLQEFGLECIITEMTVQAVVEAINRKEPVIVTLQAYRETDISYATDWADGHYVVAIGYDDQRIYFEDPSSYKRTWLTYEELEERWHDVELDGTKVIHWGCIVIGKPEYKSGESIHMD